MGQLRFPLWEPFVPEPTGPHEGTNYSDAQQDGGANLLPRCSELIITSTLRAAAPERPDGEQKPACLSECNRCKFAPSRGCGESVLFGESARYRRDTYYTLEKVIPIFQP